MGALNVGKKKVMRVVVGNGIVQAFVAEQAQVHNKWRAVVVVRVVVASFEIALVYTLILVVEGEYEPLLSLTNLVLLFSIWALVN